MTVTIGRPDETNPAETDAETDAAAVSTPTARLARGRRLPWPALICAALVVVAGLLPTLNIQLPGVLPGASYTPGTLQLLALCLLLGALAVTYNLTFAVAGMLSFGHALYFAVGAYSFAMLLEHARLSVPVAAVLALLVGLAVSVVVGLVSLRVTGISFAMVTLAFAQAASVLALKNIHGLTGGDEGLGLDSAPLPSWLVGVQSTKNLYWLSLAVAVVVVGAASWITASRAGRVMMAVRDNELRVRVLGIRPYVVRLVAFVSSGVLATILGMAYVLVQGGASPDITSSSFTLTLLVMVVLGGLDSRWGAMLGGMVYTLLDQRLGVLAATDRIAALPGVLRIPLSQPQFLLGALFVIVVLVVPGGFSGLVHRLLGRRDAAPVLDDLSAVESE